jgi:peptide/nickel transport system substrate-binding protein
MNLWGRKGRLAAVAGLVVAGLIAVGCGSSGGGSTGGGSSSSGGTAVKGGTATIALPASVTYNYIFPFYPITEASVYNLQFQYLFFRPLYMFGANSDSAVGINYPLSAAEAPQYSDGGKTVVVNLKNWKWSNGESVNAKDLIFFVNMAEAEKDNWYGYSKGLLPDNLVSYKATGPNQVTFHLNRGYSSLWFTYNQLGELKPMPMAWDVTSMSAKAGSGGCTTDSKADGWAKCKAVFSFLSAQAKQSGSYATNKLWQVVDGPWRLQSFSTTGNVTIVPNKSYSGSPKPQVSAVKFLPYTADQSEFTALKTGQVDIGYIPSADLPPKPANATLPATNPAGSNYNLQPFYFFGITYAQPNFNNPQIGYMVRQLYVRQALQSAFDQPGIIKAIYRGYAVPASGPAPNAPPGNQWIPAAQAANNSQGPYPFSIAKAKSLLTSHGWVMKGGVMTCQTPSKCGTGIKQGQQLKLTFTYSTGTAATLQMWQTYKSDASKAGISINLVGQSFNTIVGEAAPCAPMGPKCNVQVFAYGGWVYDGPGFEPTGDSLFATGAGSNAGNYSDPKMDQLITATHTSSSLDVSHQWSTYGAQQLPFIWNPNAYTIQAVTKKLQGVTFGPLFSLFPEYWHFTK